MYNKYDINNHAFIRASKATNWPGNDCIYNVLTRDNAPELEAIYIEFYENLAKFVERHSGGSNR